MRVLVAMDGSEESWAAFDRALELFPDATVTCLYVINPIPEGYGIGTEPTVIPRWIDEQKDAGAELFEEVETRGEEADIEIETRLEIGRPARTIVEIAEDHDHVVVGSHGREGVSRILLGSVAETVVRRSPTPVTVVR
jgi:nucleotide-binding universal stress UspA family protein